MKPLTWDSNKHFDDPNLRWGEPSYELEPGDSGYVPPIPLVHEPLTKQKRMKHARYYPERQADQVIWLQNFAAKLAGYATALGLAPATVTAAVADCLWMIYILKDWLPEGRAFERGCTQAMLTAQSGTGSAAVTLTTFTAPALPTGVTAQLPGSLTRIFALVRSIRKDGKCTDAIAADLRIVGSEEAVPDLSAVEPIISAVVSGSGVAIKWGWNGHRKWLSSCLIQVDRGDGKGFVLLTIDTTPNYVDTQPFPSAKTAWTYRAIYRVDDAQVGRWSQTVSVAVGG
jgi:hypothetical protein